VPSREDPARTIIVHTPQSPQGAPAGRQEQWHYSTGRPRASIRPTEAAGRPPGLKEVFVKRLRNLDLGGVLIGLIILGVGVYYFLDQTLGIALPELNWDKVWPLFIIALGAGIVFSNWARSKGGDESGT
jgi:hypothetical protein